VVDRVGILDSATTYIGLLSSQSIGNRHYAQAALNVRFFVSATAIETIQIKPRYLVIGMKKFAGYAIRLNEGVTYPRNTLASTDALTRKLPTRDTRQTTRQSRPPPHYRSRVTFSRVLLVQKNASRPLHRFQNGFIS
jgi:hypothetical protein